MLLKRAPQNKIVFALDPVSVGLPARIVSLLCFKKFMVRLGGDYAWEQGKQRYGISCRLDDFYLEKNITWQLRCFKWIQSFVVNTADKVVVPSEYLKSVFLNYGGQSSNFEVVYSVSYVHEFDGASTAPVNTDGRSPVLVSISRLVPWKGFLTLVDVVRVLKEKYPNVLLLIGGDGPQQKEIEEKITALDLQDNVKLLGLLDRKEIAALGAKTDVFVLNTEYEGFSHLLAEFMQLSVPIVTTNVGGNPELITDKESGIFVEYDNVEQLSAAVTDLIENKSLANQYAAKAKERVGEFSQERSVDRLVSILTEVGT